MNCTHPTDLINMGNGVAKCHICGSLRYANGEFSCPSHQWFEVRQISRGYLKGQQVDIKPGGALAVNEHDDIKIVEGVLVQCPNCMETKELWGKE